MDALWIVDAISMGSEFSIVTMRGVVMAESLGWELLDVWTRLSLDGGRSRDASMTTGLATKTKHSGLLYSMLHSINLLRLIQASLTAPLKGISYLERLMAIELFAILWLTKYRPSEQSSKGLYYMQLCTVETRILDMKYVESSSGKVIEYRGVEFQGLHERDHRNSWGLEFKSGRCCSFSLLHSCSLSSFTTTDIQSYRQYPTPFIII